MELPNDVIEYLAKLGAVMDAMQRHWPDRIDLNLTVEGHGSKIAAWGSEGGETVWHFDGEDWK